MLLVTDCLHLCKETCLRILNGKCGDDKNLGKFTCYNHDGSSVVDYLLTSYDNFDSISSFSVGDLTGFSKHVPITFNVKHGLDIELQNVNSSHKYIKWSCDKKEEYTHTLENHLIQLRNIVNQTNSTDCDIDSVIKDFTDVLYDASFSVFGKEFKCKSKKRYTHSPWFNEDYKTRKADFKYKVAVYKRFPTENNRNDMLCAKRNYLKSIKKAKIRYNNNEKHKVKNLAKHSPSAFWKYIKKQNNKNEVDGPSADEFIKHFSKLSTDLHVNHHEYADHDIELKDLTEGKVMDLTI